MEAKKHEKKMLEFNSDFDDIIEKKDAKNTT